MKQIFSLALLSLLAGSLDAQQFEWYPLQRPLGVDEITGSGITSYSAVNFRFDIDTADVVYADNFRWSSTDHGKTWDYVKTHVNENYYLWKWYGKKLFFGKYIYQDTGGIFVYSNALRKGILAYADESRMPYDSTNFYQSKQGAIYAIFNFRPAVAKVEDKTLLVSHDTGASWKMLSSFFPQAERVEILNVDANGKIFLSVQDSYTSHAVFISDDQGVTWDSVYDGTARGRVMSMVQLSDGSWLAAAQKDWNWWLLACDASGRNWKTVTSLAPYTISYSYGFALLSSSNGVLLAYNIGNNTSQLLRSPDNGLTWQVITAPQGVRFMSTPFVDDAGILYYAGVKPAEQRVVGDVQIFTSRDNGLNWSEGGIHHVMIKDIMVDRSVDEVVVVKASSRFYLGRNFFPPYACKLGDSLRSISHFFSSNYSQAYYYLDTGISSITIDHDGNYYGHGWLPNTPGQAFFRSTDHGTTWTIIGNVPFKDVSMWTGLREMRPPPFIARNGTLWAAMGTLGFNEGGDYIYRSADKGNSWEQLGNGITNPHIYCVGEGRSGFIFAGSQSAIYRTKELYFTKLNTNLINANVITFAFDSVGGIYAGTDRRGVTYSNDNGETWKDLSTGLPKDTAIAELLVTPNGKVIAATHDGLYVLTVGDTIWKEESMGMNDRWLLSVAMVDDDTYLVGTFNSGIYANKPFPLPAASVKLPPSVSIENGLTSASYPNPFTEETTIRFEVAMPAWVTIEIYSLLGGRLAVVEDAHHALGTYESSYKATNLPSGTYLYRLTIGSKSVVRTLIKR